jgi:hypothetical protein
MNPSVAGLKKFQSLERWPGDFSNAWNFLPIVFPRFGTLFHDRVKASHSSALHRLNPNCVRIYGGPSYAGPERMTMEFGGDIGHA